MLETVEINPSGSAECAVIWLHGLGADGHDFEAIVPELGLPSSANIRFVFPHAPIRPVTINGGMKMRAWYDILEMNIDRKVDAAAISASVAEIDALVQRELAAGIPAEKIVIAGFSQGGVIALAYGLSSTLPLAGMLALSTYFPIEQLEDFKMVNSGVPVLVGHGVHDPVVPMQLGEGITKILEKNGNDFLWRAYSMAHSVNYHEIRDIADFLREKLEL